MSKVEQASGVDFKTLRANATAAFKELALAVTLGTWTEWPIAEQIELRNTIEHGRKVWETQLRAPFDKTVWEGHTNGKVDKAVEYIRAPRTGEAPGKKVSVPTVESLMAKAGFTE